MKFMDEARKAKFEEWVEVKYGVGTDAEELYAEMTHGSLGHCIDRRSALFRDRHLP